LKKFKKISGMVEKICFLSYLLVIIKEAAQGVRIYSKAQERLSELLKQVKRRDCAFD
jgi:hypothetical protein